MFRHYKISVCFKALPCRKCLTSKVLKLNEHRRAYQRKCKSCVSYQITIIVIYSFVFNPVQSSFAFRIETSRLSYIANQMTVSFMDSNIEVK